MSSQNNTEETDPLRDPLEDPLASLSTDTPMVICYFHTRLSQLLFWKNSGIILEEKYVADFD